MPEHDLTLLRDVAHEAGEIALKYFRTDPEHWDKGDGQGPVSVADLEVNRMLEARLKQARPDYGWLSEESEDDTARLSTERVFILDPIDGTRAFLEGHENFAHSFAVAENGKVISAIVYLPAKDMCFEATLGNGAKLNGEPIQPSATQVLDGAEILISKPMMDPKHWPGGVPPVRRNFRSSLAYRLVLIAQGRFDAMFTFRPTWEWDVAAGDLICQEAGAHVFDMHGAAPRYNAPSAQSAGMIATAPGLSQALRGHLHAPADTDK